MTSIIACIERLGGVTRVEGGRVIATVVRGSVAHRWVIEHAATHNLILPTSSPADPFSTAMVAVWKAGAWMDAA